MESNEQTNVGELKRQLAETRSAQSGSDRRVTELAAEKAELEAKIAEMEKGEDPKVVALRDREFLFDRKERALNAALLHGLDPAVTMDLMGIDGADIETQAERIAAYTKETSLYAKNEVAKKHGRVMTKTGLPTVSANWDEIQHMPNERLDKMGGVLDDIMDREIDKSRPTLRKKLGGVK